KHQSMKDSSIHKRLSLNYSSGSSSSTLGAGSSSSAGGSSELCGIMERDSEAKLVMGEHFDMASGRLSSSGIGSSTSCSSTCSLQSIASQSKHLLQNDHDHAEASSDDFGSLEDGGVRQSGRFRPTQPLALLRESASLFQSPAGLFQNPMHSSSSSHQHPDVVPQQFLASSSSSPSPSSRPPQCDHGVHLRGAAAPHGHHQDSQPQTVHQQHHVSTTYITLDRADEEVASRIYISAAGPLSGAEDGGDSLVSKPNEVRISVSDASGDARYDIEDRDTFDEENNDNSNEDDNPDSRPQGLEFILSNSNIESS
ncbi:unnamed protein product, partial [Notodromas monacha]